MYGIRIIDIYQWAERKRLRRQHTPEDGNIPPHYSDFIGLLGCWTGIHQGEEDVGTLFITHSHLTATLETRRFCYKNDGVGGL
jgi:hypothetical protein